MSKRTGIMLCYPFEERRLLEAKFLWTWPVIVQPKLDGERCRVLKKSGNECKLLSSEGHEILCLPHLSDAVGALPHGEYDGELYCHGMSLQQIHSIVSRTKNIHPEAEKIQLHLFDIITPEPQFIRIEKLQRLDNFNKTFIKIVDTNLCVSTMESLYDEYRNTLSRGYEGIVIRERLRPYIRKRSRFVMKFKPKKSDIYTIIGINEAISQYGTPKGQIGAFVCTDPEGNQFSVSAGNLTHQERRDLWKSREELIGKKLLVEYQTLTARGVPRHGFCARIWE